MPMNCLTKFHLENQKVRSLIILSMHQIHSRFLKILIPIFLLVNQLIFAQDFPARPNPPRLVNDMANILSEEEKNALEYKLLNYSDSTSTQIAVVTMKSTGDFEIKDYAQRLAQQWGIGQKDKNNGIILLVAIEDRKLAIQTGYGMEGSVTDAGTKSIIEKIIKPYFKEQNYYAGLDAGTTAIIQLAKGEYKADPSNASKKGFPKKGIILILIIIAFIIFNAFRNGGKGGGRSGRYNSNGSFLGGAILGSLLGGGGRGGSWGGGGGGGGGFGGFGGGGFGGGGSSGDW